MAPMASSSSPPPPPPRLRQRWLPTTTEPPRQAFRRRPEEPRLVLWEGDSAVLDCEVDNQVGDVSWLKDKTYLFVYNRTRTRLAHSRLSIPGPANHGIHSLRLDQVRPEDSGSYECQVQPDADERNPELRMEVELVVQRPPSTQPAAPSSQHHSNHLTQNLHHQQLADPQAAMDQLDPHNHQHHQPMPATSFSSVLLTPSSSSFTRPHAAASHHPSSLQLGFLVGWPYLLLALAVILLLANIYLIYSLVVRNRRVTKRLPSTTQDANESPGLQ